MPNAVGIDSQNLRVLKTLAAGPYHVFVAH